MLTMHALWSPDWGLLLWAENTDRQREGRSSARARAGQPHPFAASTTELMAVHPGKRTSVTLLLPSRASGPIPSSEVRRAGARLRPTLRPWSVPALVVDPTELEDPADTVHYGESIAHLRAVAGLAAGLARRGRVLPTLVRTGATARARWRPVLRGVDTVTARALAAAMPPVARAEHTPRPDGRLIGADPAVLFDDALHALVDAAVRDRLARADPALDLGTGLGPIQTWLSALHHADDRVYLPPHELDSVADAVALWDKTTDFGGPEGRACVRLAEVRTLREPDGSDPEDQTGDGTRWRLQFLVQSNADPSLLIPAAQVWSGKASRLIGEPGELLVTELGRAAVVLPMLAPAVRQRRPVELDITVEEAREFLTSGARLLEEAGFGVQLPSNWGGERPLGLRLAVRSASAEHVVSREGAHREQLARFQWSVSVGDVELGAEELSELVAAKAPLIRVRGKWVSVDTDHLRAGLEFLERDRDRPKTAMPTAAEVFALVNRVSGDAPVDAPLPIIGVTSDGWFDDVLHGRLDQVLEPVTPPEGFLGALRPYQLRGLGWLAFMSDVGLGACLADDMGLGKTVQLLALEALDREGRSVEPTLLICPMSMVTTWQREAAKFAPGLRVHAHHGASRARDTGLADHIAGADLVVTTYATAVRDADELARFDWHRLVLDEAQAVKNAHTQAARAVRRFPARHRVAMTGTPVENRLAELWSLMDLLNPGVLGSAERFRQRFVIPIERLGHTEAAATLRQLVQPYLLRRVKTDPAIIDDLPEKIEITEEYRLTREQGSLYRTIVEDMMKRIEDSEGIVRRGHILSAITKLKQVCNHPAHLLHDGSRIAGRSGKVIRLEEILGKIVDSGDRVLCFTQFAEFGHLLVPHLSARFDTGVAYLHGGVSRSRRDAIVERFQAGEGPRILLLSLKAGGTGLTLTAAGHVVHLDRWWNPAVENQATDRAFRIGQKRTVQVRKFVCPGTVEERIAAMLTEKRALSGMVIGEGEHWLNELTTEKVRAVLELGAEATEEDSDA